jgi:N-acyl-D-amino-acid deacylase
MKKINRREFIYSSSITGASIFVMSNPVYSYFSRPKGFDILIKGGTILNGSGQSGFIADLGIKDGIISAIGNLNESEAAHIINANGLHVAPGFIDFHSHTDAGLIINPKAESKIRQGVTTEICGQDGSSWAPVGGPDLQRTLDAFKKNYFEELTWRTFEEFLSDFSKRKFSINLASMLGLGTVREFVVGLDDRPATTNEMMLMKEEVIKASNAGAVGLSTGLEYTPGSFASTEELIELVKAAPLKARLYSTHMRNEDNFVLEAIDEAIRIARESDARLQIAHLKTQGKTNWHKASLALERIDKAAAEGLEIHADRYPYVAYHTNLSSLFPLWSRDGGTEKFLQRLKDNSLTKDIREHVEKKVDNLDGEWNGILISSIGKEELKNLQGKTIKQIAEKRSADYFETAVNILIDTNNSAMMMGFGMEEKSTEEILAHPRVMISSDAGAHAPYPPMTRSIAHPRAYGTFPRAIAKYVRERNICSLEEMIKKMTSMPADKLGLNDRGRLLEGKTADVVIFDYKTIQDKATFVEPHQYPEGIPHVIVNGEMVIHNGEHTGAMPGKTLKLIKN